jgi:exodeoxyribonuclease VII large subunit
MHEVPAAMASVKELSAAAVREARSSVQTLLPSILDQSAAQARRAARNIVSSGQLFMERSQQVVKGARSSADALFREVTGQGPKKTLARGFAMVKSKSGQTVTSVEAAKAAGQMEVTFNDGVVRASVQDDAEQQKGGQG